MNELQRQHVQRIRFRMLHRHAVRSFKRGSMSFPSSYSVFQEVLGSFVGSIREIKWSGNTRKRRERTPDVQLLYNVQLSAHLALVSIMTGRKLHK